MHDCATIPSRTRDAGDPDPAGYFRYGAHFLDSETLAHRAVDVLSDRKALDIALLDISRTATFTDYFVIATAQSPLQFSALAEYLEKEFKPEGPTCAIARVRPTSGWMLLDFGDIIVHIFSPISAPITGSKSSGGGRARSYASRTERGWRWAFVVESPRGRHAAQRHRR